MKRIPLTQGKFALVDDDDFDLVNQRKWCAGCNGYAINSRKTEGKKKTIYMHRYIFNVKEGMKEGIVIDHINGNTLDNRRSNLRVCTIAQNSKNRKPNINSTSGFKGVTLLKETGRWLAQIKNNGHRIHIGVFDMPEDAHKAYCEKAKELHGDFARFR